MKNTTKTFTLIYLALVFGWIGYIFLEAPAPSTIFLWLFLIYIVVCVHVGIIAKKKGRSQITFSILSFIASPILMGLILAVMKNEIPVDQHTIKKCPKCAEDIKKEAVVCKFCGSEV
jgi:FtsH-binding integral membrane protein